MNNFRSFHFALILSGLTLMFVSCSKDEEQPQIPAGILLFHFDYSVDGSPLIFDTLLYVDDVAGYAYEVADVAYYLSDFRLIRQDSSELPIRNYQFVHGKLQSSNGFTISAIEPGNYIGVAFNIGLTSTLNHYGTLTDSPDSRYMQWPSQYGDGYYFFRFSGSYGAVGDSLLSSFEMAIGDDANLIPYRFYTSIQVSSSGYPLTFDMNLNEWLKHPGDYDFNTYGPYSAGNPVAMGVLKANGADALTLK